jgi:hypothetical protein
MAAVLMSQLAHNSLFFFIASAVPDMQYRIEIDTLHKRLHWLNFNGAGYITAEDSQQGQTVVKSQILLDFREFYNIVFS